MNRSTSIVSDSYLKLFWSAMNSAPIVSSKPFRVNVKQFASRLPLIRDSWPAPAEIAPSQAICHPRHPLLASDGVTHLVRRLT